jgi:peptide chain release factor 1
VFKKLALVEERYLELTGLLSDPEILGRQEQWQQYSRELASLTPAVELYRHYRELEGELDDARELLVGEQDGDLSEYLEEEIARLTAQIEQAARELQAYLLPRDPRDQKNVFLEIRAGTGGDEAALFAAELLRMYSRYAERKGWKVEVIDAHATDIGGFKEVVAGIEGKGVFSRLKYESGVHRVQRIPATESAGRIHTSAATVAVLPEAEEVEIEISPQELRIDTFCSTGPGGQSVNTTQSAVRVTHLPSGLVVTCQDEKSQLRNREKALRVMRSRLADQHAAEQAAEMAEARRSQVGSGDRSERIRTYNFPQNRVTDHRIGLTLHQLDLTLDGELDPIIDPLVASAKTEQLESAGE